VHIHDLCCVTNCQTQNGLNCASSFLPASMGQESSLAEPSPMLRSHLVVVMLTGWHSCLVGFPGGTQLPHSILLLEELMFPWL
jgi:hypothetical protein